MSTNRLIKTLLIYLFFTFINGKALAIDIGDQQQVFTAPSAPIAQKKEDVAVLSIDEKILALKKLSEHDTNAAQVTLLKLQQSKHPLNDAESYLLHLIRANIANIKGQEHKVVNWLNKAIKLETNLHDKQLNSPDFASAYLLLANVYQQQGLYKEAFDNKKKYIRKYSNHLKAQNELRIKRLNDKYQMNKKREEYELLSQNGELKRFELTKVESQRNQQNMNIVVILVVGILFFFLLLRQFKIRRQLKLLAKSDSLTKLANRRAFFKQGYRYMEHALREQSELCVLMIDIDNFKAVNDNLGHDVGDKVICLVANLASETMRSRDVLARIGGEEFAAVLPDANIDQARAIAERLREKVQNATAQENSDYAVTVSIGLASIDDAKESFDQLLHSADLAMYQAKRNGRNCVCNAPAKSNN